MKRSYIKAFRAPNILPGFTKNGTFTIDESQVLSPLRSASFQNPNDFVSSIKLIEMLEKKVKRARNGDKVQRVVIEIGQLFTREGLLATSVEVCKGIVLQEEAFAKRAHEKDGASTLVELDVEKKDRNKDQSKSIMKSGLLPNEFLSTIFPLSYEDL